MGSKLEKCCAMDTNTEAIDKRETLAKQELLTMEDHSSSDDGCSLNTEQIQSRPAMSTNIEVKISTSKKSVKSETKRKSPKQSRFAPDYQVIFILQIISKNII